MEEEEEIRVCDWCGGEVVERFCGDEVRKARILKTFLSKEMVLTALNILINKKIGE